MKELNRSKLKKVWSLIKLISSIVIISLTTLSILSELYILRFVVNDATITNALSLIRSIYQQLTTL